MSAWLTRGIGTPMDKVRRASPARMTRRTYRRATFARCPLPGADNMIDEEETRP